MPRPLIAMSLQEFFSNLEIPLLNGPLGELGGFLLAAFFHAFLLFNLFGAMPMFFIWLERKVSGRIQDRLGPTRVGGMFGWLQSIADPIKLIQKEDLTPDAADRWLFKIAPILAVLASFGAFMVLPFADGWYAVAADTGVFLILAILSLEVFGIILAGYSSGSKWACSGRCARRPRWFPTKFRWRCALVPLVTAGTLDFREIARLQEAGLHQWLIFTNPFTFAAFFVYFTTATASVKRAPFDLAEAESELVAGFHTEYSGIRWSFFFLAEYASMFAVSGIAVLLFLGGSATGLGLEPLLINPLRAWGQDFLVQGFSLGNYVANLIGASIFVFKAGVLVFVQIWVRWTLPRLRIDQVMTTCLKYLVPISCFLFLGAVLWPLLLASSTLGRPTFLPVGRSEDAVKAKTAAMPNSDFEFRISSFPPVKEGR